MTRYAALAAALATVLLTLGACSISDLVNKSELPPDTRDPSAVQTPDGAVGAYNAAVLSLTTTFAARAASDETSTPGSNPSASVVYAVGLMTDELSWVIDIGSVDNGLPNTSTATVSSRTAPENDFSAAARTRALFYRELYLWLQTIRSRARNASGALAKYAPDKPKALRGHLYAMEGYADVMMAEIFCSGIPLSVLNFEGAYDYSPGLSTDSVYKAAIVRLDSAIVLAADSARIVNFAKLVRARALLNMGDFARAAQGLGDVPTNFQYLASYAALRPNIFYSGVGTNYPWGGNVADSIGINGLKYPGDPRSDTVPSYGSAAAAGLRRIPKKFLPAGTVSTPVTIGGVPFPNYINTGTVSVPVESGIAARLIEAEVALKQGSATWLTILNELRTTCATTAGCATPAPAGSGGYAGLPPLSDPGTPEGRLSLLFNERAHWLYLTGHRQGDMRRLVRLYERRADQVYPIGPWGPMGMTPYGSDVNLPLPVEEQELNPLYHGCLDRDA